MSEMDEGRSLSIPGYHAERTDDRATQDAQTRSTTVNEKSGEPIVDVAEDEPKYAEGWRLTIMMFTIFLSTLLGALDLGIVATAIPAITDEFHQINDVGWYGAACFLLVGTSAPIWGKLYKYFAGEVVYLVSILLYLIGSIVAATAPNSPALIVGRAIQGFGCSGTLSGSVLLINYIAEPKKRPMLIGVWMGVFMFSTIIGPIIGGAFTTNLTWRWCFWLNLPVGGAIIAMQLLFLRIPKHIKPAAATWVEKLAQLDLPGFCILLASVICFTLALQWGGQVKSWSDGSVIATMVLFGVLSVAFVIIEWFEGDYAMVPLRLLRPRMAWANVLFSHILNFADFTVMFYLPIYFQSIHGQSAITSGVNTLPFLAFFAVGALLSGGLVGKTHFLQPYEIASALLSTAGAALLYTLNGDSSKARYIGPQVLFGFGIGLGNQIPMMALQALSTPADVASMTSIVLMANALSGAYYVTASQSIFANRLLKAIERTAPHISAVQVIATGATDIRRVFTGSDLTAVLDAYVVGIRDVFAFALAGSGCAVLIALVIPPVKLPGSEVKHAELQEGKSAAI